MQQQHKIESPAPTTLITSHTPQLHDTTAAPEVDKDGYCIKPEESNWPAQGDKKGIHLNVSPFEF